MLAYFHKSFLQIITRTQLPGPEDPVRPPQPSSHQKSYDLWSKPYSPPQSLEHLLQAIKHPKSEARLAPLVLDLAWRNAQIRHREPLRRRPVKALNFQSSDRISNCQIEVLFKWSDQSCTASAAPVGVILKQGVLECIYMGKLKMLAYFQKSFVQRITRSHLA